MGRSSASGFPLHRPLPSPPSSSTRSMALRQRRPRGVRTTRGNRAFEFTIEGVRPSLRVDAGELGRIDRAGRIPLAKSNRDWPCVREV